MNVVTVMGMRCGSKMNYLKQKQVDLKNMNIYVNDCITHKI